MSDTGPAQQDLPLVTIVGGGLAGMMAALRLTQRGFPVRLYEADVRLGGKAGSDPDPNGANAYSDHGYHIFPHWYRNVWALIDELGIRRSFYETNEFYRIDRRNGNAQGPLEFSSPKKSIRLVASLVDLCSRGDAYVDKLTLKGFLRSRYYNSPYVSGYLDDLVLKALSNHAYNVSSRTMRNTFRQWLPVIREPAWTALTTSLQEGLIHPFRDAFVSKTEFRDLHLDHRLVDIRLVGNQVDQLTIEHHGNQNSIPCANLPVVLALPPEVLRGFMGDTVFDCDPQLCELEYLRTDPLGAVDVHFHRRIPGLTREHFSLTGSRHAITGFDISQHWPNLVDDDRTVLQLVAGDVTNLTPLSDDKYAEVLLEELREYIPFAAADVDRCVVHKNVDAPLMMNDVGTWEKRPRTTTKLENCFLAGDFVRSEVDVASMENAVTTGILAAEAVRAKYADHQDPIPTAPIKRVPTPLMTVLRYPLGLAALATRLFDGLRFPDEF